MKLKIFCAVLAMLLMVTCFVACVDKPAAPNESEGTTTSTVGGVDGPTDSSVDSTPTGGDTTGSGTSTDSATNPDWKDDSGEDFKGGDIIIIQ